MGGPVRHAVHDARDDHAAVAVADEDEVAQVLVLNDVDHVLDVGAQVRLRRAEVHALADAGEGRREDRVTGAPEQGPHALPDEAASPGAVHENEARHLPSFSVIPSPWQGEGQGEGLYASSSSSATSSAGRSSGTMWPQSISR